VVCLPDRGWALPASTGKLLASREVSGQPCVTDVDDAWLVDTRRVYCNFRDK